MSTIDVSKVTKSFDHLAETDTGRRSLLEFRESIEALRGGIPKGLHLNNHEFLAVLQKLVLQMRPETLGAEATKDGSLSDAQLENVAGGAVAPMFTTEIKRLGQIRSIGNLGFNIMIVA